jgi:hypothetical protein
MNLYSLFVYTEHNGDESPKVQNKFNPYFANLEKMVSS